MSKRRDQIYCSVGCYQCLYRRKNQAKHNEYIKGWRTRNLDRTRADGRERANRHYQNYIDKHREKVRLRAREMREQAAAFRRLLEQTQGVKT